MKLSRQKQSLKFYFVDCGIKRALEGTLSMPLLERTSEYGNAFESWFIAECFARNQYLKKGYKFSYLRTKDDVEIDLIIQKPNGDEYLVEIKSTTQPTAKHLKNLVSLKKDFPQAKFYCVCRVEQAQKWDHVNVISWEKAFQELGLT